MAHSRVKVTLLQHASGRFIDLQTAIATHHAAYAAKHGYLYSLTLGKVQDKFHPIWDRVPLIQSALLFSDLVIWLDADTLITDCNVPLTDALKEMRQPVGHVHHPEPWDGRDHHHNCGVGFYLKSRRASEFLRKVMAMGEIKTSHWKVQATMLTVGYRMGIFSRIDDKWNSTFKTNVSPNPVIESWHGNNRDFAPILERLEQVRLGARW